MKISGNNCIVEPQDYFVMLHRAAMQHRFRTGKLPDKIIVLTTEHTEVYPDGQRPFSIPVEFMDKYEEKDNDLSGRERASGNSSPIETISTSVSVTSELDREE